MDRTSKRIAKTRREREKVCVIKEKGERDRETERT